MVIGGFVVANVLTGVLATTIGGLANLFTLLAVLFQGFVLFRMASELKNFTNNPDFAPWMAFVPCLNIWFMVVKVPEEMTRAKQMAGVQNPTKGAALYFLLGPWALASDLNDLAGP
jgi:hypothetical protein